MNNDNNMNGNIGLNNDMMPNNGMNPSTSVPPVMGQSTMEPQPVPVAPVQPVMEPQPVPVAPVQPVMEPQPVPVAPAQPMMEPQPVPVAPVQPVMEPQPVPVAPTQPVMGPQPVPVAPVQPVMGPQPLPVQPNAGMNAVGDTNKKSGFDFKKYLPIILIVVGVIVAGLVVWFVFKPGKGGADLVCTNSMVESGVVIDIEHKFIKKSNLFNSNNKMTIYLQEGTLEESRMESIVNNFKPSITAFGGGFNEQHKYENGKVIITWSGSHYNYTDAKQIKSELVEVGYKCK